MFWQISDENRTRRNSHGFEPGRVRERDLCPGSGENLTLITLQAERGKRLDAVHTGLVLRPLASCSPPPPHSQCKSKRWGKDTRPSRSSRKGTPCTSNADRLQDAFHIPPQTALTFGVRRTSLQWCVLAPALLQPP